MKKIVSMLGIIGIILLSIFSIIDHIFFLDDKVYSILMLISFVMLLPMLIREALSLRNRVKEKGNEKNS